MGEGLSHSRALYLLVVLALLLTVSIVESLHYRNSIFNASAVETMGTINVYWDRYCRRKVSSIDWGTLTPGQTINLTVYVRNEGTELIRIIETPTNWNPTTASQYLSFAWTPNKEKIAAGEVVRITQTLYVATNIKGISSFSFDIVFQGVEYLQGDINKDGVVDGKDVSIFAKAFNSTPQDPNWNPDADLNKDGVVDGQDAAILSKDYGKPW